MKRSVLVLSLVLVLMLVVGLVGASAAPDQSGKVRVMVQYRPEGRGAVEQALKGAGAEIHYSFDHLNTFAVTLPKAAADALGRNPNVAFVEEDAPRYPISISQSAASAPVFAGGQTVPYGVDMVQARDVWDVDRNGTVDAGAPTGAGRKICIIDSGFYTQHEDLQGVTVSGYNGNLGWDSGFSDHGTHVAGTIVAMNNALGVVGVTPGTVSIYVVRVFGDDGTWAYSSDLADAANRCAAAGANIISMSLGGSLSNRTEKNTFANLYSQGILSIAAAGNDGNNRNSYPASYDAVVSVAAIDSNKVVASFSQYNSQVELAGPGVGVLSTVPYQDATSLTVGGVTYGAGHIEFSPRGSASGALVSGGLCDSVGSWAGKIVLCERGVISFYDKVHNVELGGGVAAAIYNNVPGGFSGTLGAGNTSTILGVSLSQEDGQYLVANKLGSSATITSDFTQPASGYELYDGTSMATPHVSAVAALVWSAKPSATAADIRAVLQSTAEDLGAAGRDVYYGYGLVQAKAAIDALTGGGGGGGGNDAPIHVASVAGSSASVKGGWNATATVTVVDANGAAVAGVVVDGAFNSSTLVSCTTGINGQCSVTAKVSTKISSVNYSVTNLTASGYYYDAAANAASSVDITKP